MIRTGKLHVNVEEGSFPSEKVVTFNVGDQQYTLFVDERDVHNNTIDVTIVAKNGDKVLIDLPTDTFISGSRVLVPKNLLQVDEAQG